MNFDMNHAWTRGVELIRENFQLLVVIAGVFLLLPSIAAYMFVPDFALLADPTADPDILAAQMADGAVPIFGVSFMSMLAQFAGYGAMIALMGPARPTVGEAIGVGFKVMLSTIAVFFIFMAVYMISATLIFLPIALLGSLLGPGVFLVFALAFLPILFGVVYLMARMSMSMPVLVLGGTLNPISAVMRSFRLTHKQQWSILLFWTVLFVGYFIIAMLFSGGFAVIAAAAGGGTVSGLILGLTNGILGMGIGMLVCAIAVAVYGQLAGPTEEEVTSVFE